MKDAVKPAKLFHPSGSKSKKAAPKYIKKDAYWNWVAEIERKEKTSTIGSAIFAFLELMGMREKVYEQSVLEVWDEVVGEEISKMARPRSISAGILAVTVKDSTWRLELDLLAEEIRTKLNQRMGKTVVSKLKFS